MSINASTGVLTFTLPDDRCYFVTVRGSVAGGAFDDARIALQATA